MVETRFGTFLPYEKLGSRATRRNQWRIVGEIVYIIVLCAVIARFAGVPSSERSESLAILIPAQQVVFGLTALLRFVELYRLCRGPYPGFSPEAELGFLIGPQGFGGAIVEGESFAPVAEQWSGWQDFSALREKENTLIAVRTDWKSIPIPPLMAETFRRSAKGGENV